MISRRRRLARHLHRLPNLPVRMMAVLVEQRRRNLHFERLFVQQIDDRLAGAIGSPAINSRAACRNSRRVSISYAFGSAYFTSVGATRTSRSNSCSARAPKLRIYRPNLRHQILQRLGIHVVRRARRRLLQRLAQRPHLFMRVRQQMRHLRSPACAH